MVTLVKNSSVIAESRWDNYLVSELTDVNKVSAADEIVVSPLFVQKPNKSGTQTIKLHVQACFGMHMNEWVSFFFFFN